MGILQYCQDHDEFLPPTQQAGHPWTDFIEPYVKSRQLYACPSDTVQRVSGKQIRSYGLNRGPNFTFNGVTQNWGITAGSGNIGVPKNIAAIQDTAGVISIGERPDVNNYYGNQSFSNVDNPNSQVAGLPAPQTPLHFGGWNYAFLDGHAKWLTPERTIGKGTMASPRGMWTIIEGD